MNDPKDKNNSDKENAPNAISPEIEVGKKLVDTLDNILKNKNDWGSTLFLNTIKNKLEKLLQEAKEVVQEVETASGDSSESAKALKPGYTQIYILLYQFEGNKIQNWQYALRALAEHNTNRPAYINEKDVQELIRSKREAEKYGYAIVNVKDDHIYRTEKKTFDPLDHELLALKEGSITIMNIISFVHANKKYYHLENGILVYKGERSGAH